MKSWRLIAFGVLLGFIGSAIIWLTSSPPRGEPIKLMPPPTEQPLFVYVAGAVVNPGVYQLKRGSRAQDAIQIAGGVTDDGNIEALNLAKVIKDGERIWVPPEGSTPNNELVMNEGGEFIININTADQKTLEELPGIGPVISQKIVQYRQEHGLFEKIEDIQNVPGIGSATFETLKLLITVGQ